MDAIYEVVGIGEDGENKVFKLYPIDEGISFKPGQFVKLSKADGSIGRPYSIASPPSWPYLEFLVKITGGEFTSYLDKISVGEKLLVSKAAGHLGFGGERKAVFIAGGVGISPIMSILRHIEENKTDGDYWLFYSARHVRDMPYLSEIMSMGHVKKYLTLTREERRGFHNGRISMDEIASTIGDVKEYTYYMCGRLEMVNGFRKALMGAGVSRERIKVEGWG